MARQLLFCVLYLIPSYAENELLQPELFFSASLQREHGCSIHATVTMMQTQGHCAIAPGDELFCGTALTETRPLAKVLQYVDAKHGKVRMTLASAVICGQRDEPISYASALARLSHLWGQCNAATFIRRRGRTGLAVAKSCDSRGRRPAPIIRAFESGGWLCSPLGLCGEVYLQSATTDWLDPVRDQLFLLRPLPDPEEVTQNPDPGEAVVFAELEDTAAFHAAAETALGTNLIADAAGGPGLGEEKAEEAILSTSCMLTIFISPSPSRRTWNVYLADCLGCSWPV